MVYVMFYNFQGFFIAPLSALEEKKENVSQSTSFHS